MGRVGVEFAEVAILNNVTRDPQPDPHAIGLVAARELEQGVGQLRLYTKTIVGHRDPDCRGYVCHIHYDALIGLAGVIERFDGVVDQIDQDLLDFLADDVGSDKAAISPLLTTCIGRGDTAI